jgi:ubiquinone/menaquinone biosynthesis C-methylase UbiE
MSASEGTASAPESTAGGPESTAGGPEGIAGVFDRAADAYDGVGVPWFGPIAQGLVEELAVRPGERVLDIGCGRGAALVPLALATGPEGSVLGLDLAPRMVQLLAADVGHLPQAEVRVADAAAPGLPPASFDVIASSLVLFFLPDPAAAVRTWAQLLVPGGRLGVTTFGAQDERWTRIDALFMPYLPQAMLDARTSGTRGPFGSDEGVARLLTDAGLAGVRTAHRTVTADFRDAEQLIAFTWSHGQRAMWEAVPESERGLLRRRITEQATEFGDETGSFSFTQEVRHTLAEHP